MLGCDDPHGIDAKGLPLRLNRCRTCDTPHPAVSKDSGNVCSEACRDRLRAIVDGRRKLVLSRFGARCVYCGHEPPPQRAHRLKLDRFVPLACGASLDVQNLVPSCEDCDAAKGQLEPSVFLADRLDLYDWICGILATPVGTQVQEEGQA